MSLNKTNRKIKMTGFTKQEQRAFQLHNKRVNEANAQGQNLNRSISYITFEVLYDKFDFGMKKIENFCNKVREHSNDWYEEKDGWTSKELLNWSNNKGLMTYKFVKAIPMSSKLKLAQKNSGKHILGIEADLDSRLLIMMIITEKVLIENYKFSKKMIAEYCKWISYFIDSYIKGYLSDDMVRELFLEEQKYDIREGKKVS